MKYKKNINFLSIILLVVSCLTLIYLCVFRIQSHDPFLMPFVLEGEYSVDEGATWNELTGDTRISAKHPSLILKGNLTVDLLEGDYLNFYKDHITARILLNGDVVYDDEKIYEGLNSSLCGAEWANWQTDGILITDELEIYLGNPHSFGNMDAYNEFLTSMYSGSPSFFQSYMGQDGDMERTAGLLVILLGFVLLGVTGFAWFTKTMSIDRMMHICLLCLAAGGYICMDSGDWTLVYTMTVFNTYGKQLMLMIAAYELLVCLSFYIKNETIKNLFLSVNGILNVLLVLISVLTERVIYDTLFVWLIIQGISYVFMTGHCIWEWVKKPDQRGVESLPAIILCTVVSFEIARSLISGNAQSGMIKTVFLVLVVISILYCILVSMRTYTAAQKAKILEQELEDNRIAIMISQIQPHFMFNSLTAIAQLCKKDPIAAKNSIILFANYLRGNMDALQNKDLIFFSRELEHINMYISLEQLCYGDALQVEYDIQTTAFSVPPLTIQPLVENAIKHGVGMKEDGGYVRIRTEEEDNCVKITIQDDGVGFEVGAEIQDGESHIGIKNVKRRLQYMCNATLEIDSRIGYGTCAVIKIPKGVNVNGYSNSR